jgi:hypothetical protein
VDPAPGDAIEDEDGADVLADAPVEAAVRFAATGSTSTTPHKGTPPELVKFGFASFHCPAKLLPGYRM